MISVCPGDTGKASRTTRPCAFESTIRSLGSAQKGQCSVTVSAVCHTSFRDSIAQGHGHGILPNMKPRALLPTRSLALPFACVCVVKRQLPVEDAIDQVVVEPGIAFRIRRDLFRGLKPGPRSPAHAEGDSKRAT